LFFCEKWHFFGKQGAKGGQVKLYRHRQHPQVLQAGKISREKIELLEGKKLCDFSVAKREKLHRIKIFFSVFFIFFQSTQLSTVSFFII